MSVEAIGAAAPAVSAFEPRVQSFLDVAADVRRGLSADVTGNGSPSLLGSVRPMLDGLMNEQRRIDRLSSALEVKVRPSGQIGEGEGAKVGSDSPVDKALEKINAAGSNMIEVASFMTKILLVNKGVQGLQRVWDTLSKGQ
jgi:hypothetical protein